jgi:uncharacterized protein (DUF433 family)
VQRITSNPCVRWGTPCVRDTGVSVGRVVTLFYAGGLSAREVADACPGLDADDVEAALAWHREHGDEGLRPSPPDPGSRHPRVVVDPAVQGGYPTVRGTRIPVDVVVAFRDHGLALDQLLAEYPGLTAEDVEDALAYAVEAGA